MTAQLAELVRQSVSQSVNTKKEKYNEIQDMTLTNHFNKMAEFLETISQ